MIIAKSVRSRGVYHNESKSKKYSFAPGYFQTERQYNVHYAPEEIINVKVILKYGTELYVSSVTGRECTSVPLVEPARLIK